MKLLSREDARELTFKRDQHKCIFCPAPAVDAHHIIERKLWSNGGYFLDNLASVCDKHHRLCEECIITVEEVRQAAGITNVIVPEGFDPEAIYDKWGKMRYKFPRTYHFDWSLSLMNDDRRLPSLDTLIGKEVIVTEKLDGENTTIYRDGIHARSIDSSRQHHPSRNWVKQFAGEIAHNIPEGWRICGENMYAKHSIFYDNLDSYFYGFAVYDERNVSLSWDETVSVFDMLGITPVPTILRGEFNEQVLRYLAARQDPEKQEGYVCRVVDEMPHEPWFLSAAKYVRSKHVNTDQHWMTAEIVPNRLRTESFTHD